MLPQRLRRDEQNELPAGISIEIGPEPPSQLGVYRSESPLVSGRMTIRLRRMPLRYVLGRFMGAVVWWGVTWPYWLGDIWTVLVCLFIGLLLAGWAFDGLQPLEITADRDMLTVRRRGPSMQRAGTRLRTPKLQRIFATEHPPGTHEEGERTLYSVHARTIDGQTTALVEGLHEPEVALVIERRLTDHLGLRGRDELGSGG